MTTIGKICKWTSLILIAVLILGGVSLWLFFPVEKAKQYAIEKGTAILEREIQIENASVSFWGGVGIQLENIVIKNSKDFSSDNLLSAKALDVKLQFIPLLFSDFAVDRLILKDPKIRLHKLKDGRNNFTFSKLEQQAPSDIVENVSPETKAATAIVTFENIELQQGDIYYLDDSSNTEFRLQGLNLHTTLTHPQDDKYVSSGEISVRTIQLDNDLSLPEINLNLQYESQFNQTEKSIVISKATLELNGVALTIKGKFDNIFSSIVTNLNIKSENEDIQNLLSFVPQEKQKLIEDYQIDGELNFDIDIEYDSKKLLYFGMMKLQNITAAHGKVPGTFVCKEVLVDVKDNNLRFNLKEAQFDGNPLKGYLTIDNFDEPFINGAFAGSLNLKYVEPFLPVADNHTLNGIAIVDLKASGLLNDATNLKINGVLKSDNFSYNSSFMLEPIDSSTMEIYFDNEIVSIKKISAKTKSGTILLDGRVTSLLQYLLADSVMVKNYNPIFNANLRGDLQLSILNQILPAKGNPHMRGDLSVDLKLSGSIKGMSHFKPFGEIKIENGYYSYELIPENIENFNAQLSIMPDTIVVHELHATFESSDAQFSGKLMNPFPYLLPLKNIKRGNVKKPLFLFTLHSNRFNADKLFPEAVPGVGDENTTVSIDSISTLILPDMDGRGTFTIDTLIYSKVELTSLKGNITIENKKIECYDVTGDVYTGKIEGNTTVDLTDIQNPKYTGTFNATQIEVNDFAERFSKIQNIIFGKVDMKGSYSAEGWEPEQFMNSLTMNSISNIRQGKLKLSGDVFATSKKLFERFNYSLLKEQTIRDMFSNIIVENGNVSFDKMTVTLGEIGNLDIDGFYNYSGAMAYDGKIKLSDKLTKQITSVLTDGVASQDNLLGGITKFLTKNSSIGSITLNTKISGTIENPKFNLELPSLLK